MTLPNFMIVGAARCGTTAMTRFLQQHPEVSIPFKEPGYFSGWWNPGLFAGPGYPKSHRYPGGFPSLDAYQALYEGSANAQARGDASVSYLIDPDSARRIAEQIPDARIIAILRQPVERAYAHFIHARTHGVEPCSDFLQCLDQDAARRADNWLPVLSYLHSSRYVEQLTRYFECFDPIQIRIYLYDDWNCKPETVWTDLMRFLEIDPGFTPDFSVRHNESMRQKPLWTYVKPILKLARPLVPDAIRPQLQSRIISLWHRPTKLPPELRRRLTKQFFEDDINQLEHMLGRDMRNWLT